MSGSDAGTAGGLVTDVRGLLGPAGTHLGFTESQETTQGRVDAIADVTGDHQS